ncbi:MAG: DUF1697 domain-containing protein [Rhodobacter sp.]|nr:DUF1697 domain-containing protein [Rhodobacter sp.]
MSGRPDTPRAVLLRGVNVGGTNRLPMAGFRSLLEGLGLTRVESFIQSGNAVFCGGGPDASLGPAISAAIGAAYGYAPRVFLCGLARLEAALDHPFGAAADPARIHAVFLAEVAPGLDEARLQAARVDEAWVLRPGLFLLHSPGGTGRSKLAAVLPRALPVAQTARNLHTVAALVEMLRSRSREDGAG